MPNMGKVRFSRDLAAARYQRAFGVPRSRRSAVLPKVRQVDPRWGRETPFETKRCPTCLTSLTFFRVRRGVCALAWAWPGDSLHGEGPCDVDAKGAASVTAHLDRVGALREWFEQQPESIRYDWAVRTRLKTEDGVLWEKDIENG